MVNLSPRFLLLAALVATAAMPSFVLRSDARAINLAQRHHDKSSGDKHSASSYSSKGHGKMQKTPTIPLPLSKAIKGQGKASKKHNKGGKKHERAVPATNSDTWDPLDPLIDIGGVSIGDGRGGSYSDSHDLLPGLAGILRRDPHSEHHHHHHHHHDRRQEPEIQATFSLHRRARSRIYGKREREIAEIEKQEMLDAARAKFAAEGTTWDMFDPLLKVGNFEIGDGRHGSFSDTHTLLPRSPDPHHHHHHHHGHHDEVVVNGDNDKVHVHEKKEPHHHHHHHHHGDHDKTVINGDNDDVHIHERRDPRHHHHHHHHHDENKTVINGNNDNVHIHNRGVNSQYDMVDVNVGIGMCGGVINGHVFDCGYEPLVRNKRSGPLENMPGVPGTVDIMAVAGSMKEKLASLILSSVPETNSSATDGSKVADDGDASRGDSSPFVLDASNSTQTQFFLVAETAPSLPSAPSTSFANTLSVLKTATSSKSDIVGSQDIKVTLQVMVFEPAEAAMRAYCATFDPNPPAPAALTMERCMSDDDSENTGKMTETSLHKSQTFLYNSATGILRPKWFGITGDTPVNATDPSPSVPFPSNGTASASSSSADPSSTSSTASGGPLDAKQMNFKIPTSNKNAPAHMPGPVSSVVGNVTQVVNGTVPGSSSLPVPSAPNPQNVTLVFTPVGMAVHSVNGASDVAAFEPVGGNTDASNSDSGSGLGSGLGSDAGAGAGAGSNFMDASPLESASSSTSTSAADSSSGSATTTDSTSISEFFAMDATSVSASATASASDSDPGTMATTESMSMPDSESSSMPTSTVSVVADSPTIDEAAMEKMYQQPRVS